MRRSYSVCSGCDDGELRVAVKKVPGGRFSVWVNEALKSGDAIDVMTPEGRFFTPLGAEHAKHYVAFVAGSGITPLMSMTRWLCDLSAGVDIKLLNSVKTPADLVFHHELEMLAARYRNVAAWSTTADALGSPLRRSCTYL